MSDIPAARAILADALAKPPEEHASAIKAALALMTRRPAAKPIARAQSRPLSPDLAAKIRSYVRANPDQPSTTVAALFDVNPGRVSEAPHHDC